MEAICCTCLHDGRQASMASVHWVSGQGAPGEAGERGWGQGHAKLRCPRREVCVSVCEKGSH